MRRTVSLVVFKGTCTSQPDIMPALIVMVTSWWSVLDLSEVKSAPKTASGTYSAEWLSTGKPCGAVCMGCLASARSSGSETQSPAPRAQLHTNVDVRLGTPPMTSRWSLIVTAGDQTRFLALDRGSWSFEGKAYEYLVSYLSRRRCSLPGITALHFFSKFLGPFVTLSRQGVLTTCTVSSTYWSAGTRLVVPTKTGSS